MNIDVIMLAYSRDHAIQKMTQDAIDSLHKSSDKHQFRVILVESKREPVAYVGVAETLVGEVPFNYNRNLNLGMTKSTADWIVFANNDLIFHKDWIDPILAGNYDSASPISPSWQPHKGSEGKLVPGFHTSIEVCGWCIVVKKGTMEKLGPFDEQFSDYYQDNDYALQLVKHQLQHVLVGTAQVTHLCGQTLGQYGTAPVSAKMREAQAKFEAKYAHPKICLTMIVKNEKDNMLPLFENIKGKFDYWCIVDTGSTDGTQQIIRDYFAANPVPGELHERPWVNFGVNRTEAFNLADGHGDYMWVLDADDRIHGDLSFKGLILDTYQLRIGTGFSHWRNQLFRCGLKWEYRGVLHEYAFSPLSKTGARLDGKYHVEARTAGVRSQDPEKYKKDAALLEEALKAEPDNARYWFYLGQSYFDSHDFVNAKRCYEKRVQMGGWPEEQFYAAWRVGQCAMALKETDDNIILYMLRAYEIRPNRAESLHNLAEYLRLKNKFALAYCFAKTAASLPFPANDVLFVFQDVYDYRSLDEQGISAYYIGRFAEAAAIFEGILAEGKYPPAQRDRLVKNLDFSKAKIGVHP